MRKPAEQFRRPFVLTDVRCVKVIICENDVPNPRGPTDNLQKSYKVDHCGAHRIEGDGGEQKTDLTCVGRNSR